MAKVREYTSINVVLDRLLRNPLLDKLDKETVIMYLVDFISICGYKYLYEHREDDVNIKDYRGVLPCDVISVEIVKDKRTNKAIRAMTDMFLTKKPYKQQCDTYYESYDTEKTWKLQGRVIYTSFKEGDIFISYTTIKTDSDGFPMVLDDGIFLKAFEAYIKKEEYSLLFDQGKLNNQILQHAEQQYAWLAGQLRSDMITPDVSQMEAIRRSRNTLIETDTHFNNSFRDLGNQEYIRNH